MMNRRTQRERESRKGQRLPNNSRSFKEINKYLSYGRINPFMMVILFMGFIRYDCYLP